MATPFVCPGCSAGMERRVEPDMATHVCPACGGTFLDAGELNALATGISGDIELCSVDTAGGPDVHGIRRCPSCPDQDLQKVNLLQFSGLIFDHCPRCGGFFLDRNEIQAMNAELLALSDGAHGEEMRETRDGRLVRIDRLHGAMMVADPLVGGVAPQAMQTVSFRVSVFFTRPFTLDLRVYQADWPAKIARVIGIFGLQDVATGDKPFDRAFILQGRDEDAVRRLFSAAPIRERLQDFVCEAPPIFTRRGKLEIVDAAVVYTEGPYQEDVADVVGRSGAVVERLLAITRALEAGRDA